MAGARLLRSAVAGKSDVQMTGRASIRVRGVVQGVGFRPFVFRLAQREFARRLGAERGRGRRHPSRRCEPALDAFLQDSRRKPPPAAQITAIDVRHSERCGPEGFHAFVRAGATGIPRSASLPTCLYAKSACASFRSGGSAISLSLHQLHELRSPLHGHREPSL